MDSRYTTYGLHDVIKQLTKQCEGIRAVHIFGSRRHRTLSTRSDLDLILEAAPSLRPEDAREFALQKCPILDLFFLEGGVATSCANGSRVRAKNKRELLSRLNAITIWDSKRKFHEVDIDWEVVVIKGPAPPMTTLISASPLPDKEAVGTGDVAATPLPHKRFDDWKLYVGACLIVGSTYTATERLRVNPLQATIKDLRFHISNGIEDPVRLSPLTPSAAQPGAGEPDDATDPASPDR